MKILTLEIKKLTLKIKKLTLKINLNTFISYNSLKYSYFLLNLLYTSSDM